MQSAIAQTGMQLQSKTFLGHLEYHKNSQEKGWKQHQHNNNICGSELLMQNSWRISACQALKAIFFSLQKSSSQEVAATVYFFFAYAMTTSLKP